MAEKNNITPLLQQYFEIRKAYPDYLLFFRLGDFYEMFFDDAVTASKALDLVLTKRGYCNGDPVPMCGVPFHAYENYLARLIKQGYKVAICEQMEDPAEAKKRGSKSVVKRDVIRLVTAGTLTEDTILDSRKNNFLLSVVKTTGMLGASWLDISTGDFYTEEIPFSGNKEEQSKLGALLARLSPVEILISDNYLQSQHIFEIFADYRPQLSVLPQARFNAENAMHNLLQHFNVSSMEVYGSFSKEEITAAGILLDYVKNTQKSENIRIEKPIKVQNREIMEIDASTRRSLEIICSTSSVRNSSLLDVIDNTATSIGARMLASRLSNPILNIEEINNRLDAISFFVENANSRNRLIDLLKGTSDAERALSRLIVGRGGPRDMASIAETLALLPKIKNILASPQENIFQELPPAIQSITQKFGEHQSLVLELQKALAEDLPLLARDGGFVASGYYPPLDNLRELQKNTDACIQKMQEKYETETGIPALKIKNNTLIGHFIEVPSKYAVQMMENQNFIHRQSVLNAVRYTTPELNEFENEIRNAADKALNIELEIFNNLLNLIRASSDDISRSLKAVGELDIAASFANLAIERKYCRPQVDNSFVFEIKEGRHPVVEVSLSAEGQNAFVCNDCALGEKNSNIWLITGPNMAGKSTFLRQNALIAVMAQAGFFVPAKSAHIGVVNKLFSRVGASDDLARGRSTFMVEMVETSAILNQADERSLVILDEIGRGTATFDGLSIAWAVVEHLHEINHCRALFATHYHELTSLSQKLNKMSLHCMKIKEYQGDVVFMHEVIDGAADRSYGIHVAKLAGLPPLAVKRAEQVLASLENDKKNTNIKEQTDDLPLFSTIKTEPEKPQKSPALEALEQINPDALSPREALDELYKLKEILKCQNS